MNLFDIDQSRGKWIEKNLGWFKILEKGILYQEIMGWLILFSLYGTYFDTKR